MNEPIVLNKCVECCNSGIANTINNMSDFQLIIYLWVFGLTLWIILNLGFRK